MSAMEDDDSSGEEEEILVFADFRDMLDKDIRDDGKLKYVNVVGIDSENPIIQLNNYFFKGEYEKSMGTHMFLEVDPSPPEMDPIFTEVPTTPLRYSCLTRKVLNMQRVFLTHNDPNAAKDENVQEVPLELEGHASTATEALDNLQAYMEENDKAPGLKAKSKSSLLVRTPGKKKGAPERPKLDDDIE